MPEWAVTVFFCPKFDERKGEIERMSNESVSKSKLIPISYYDPSKETRLSAYAGVDAPPYQSGTVDVHSRSITKRGSPSLRRTLFLVMSVLLQKAPPDQPVYQFLNKKRAQGKSYKVYMMAASNKFLRIYYAKVKAVLDTAEKH